MSKSVVSICDSAGVIDLTRPHYLRVACRQHFLVTTLPLGHWGVEQGGVPKLLSLLLLNARYCQSLFFLWLLYSMQSKFDPFFGHFIFSVPPDLVSDQGGSRVVGSDPPCHSWASQDSIGDR